jgi:hypothetical protein
MNPQINETHNLVILGFSFGTPMNLCHFDVVSLLSIKHNIRRRAMTLLKFGPCCAQ